MILQSVPPQPVGGAEIQALRLSKELVKLGVKVVFVTPGIESQQKNDSWDDIPVVRLHSVWNYPLDWMFKVKKKAARPVSKIEYDDATEKTNIISTSVNMGARLRYTIFYRNMISFLQQNKDAFDIIHTHTIEWPAYVGALLSRRFRKKLVVKDSTMNGIYSMLRYPSGEKKRAIIISQAHFVAMTRSIQANLVQAGVPAGSISKIPNGIPTDDCPQNSFQENRKVYFTGNLYQQPAKGADILLKAWVHVQQKVPGATLYIIGDGDLPAYHAFTEKIGIASSVKFLGKQANTGEWLQDAAVFVLPSRREGMPNALLEAMLRGIPCVATDISGCQDLIVNEKNGLLVPPAAIQPLADAIIFMLNNPGKAQAMGMFARETVINSYDIRLIAGKYFELYTSLLKNETTN